MSLRHSKTASLTWPFQSWCWLKQHLWRKHTSGSSTPIEKQTLSNTKPPHTWKWSSLTLIRPLIHINFIHLRTLISRLIHRLLWLATGCISPHIHLCSLKSNIRYSLVSLTFLASREHISFSIWDRWNIYGHEDFTLSDFINAVRVSRSECWLHCQSQQLYSVCYCIFMNRRIGLFGYYYTCIKTSRSFPVISQ